MSVNILFSCKYNRKALEVIMDLILVLSTSPKKILILMILSASKNQLKSKYRSINL